MMKQDKLPYQTPCYFCCNTKVTPCKLFAKHSPSHHCTVDERGNTLPDTMVDLKVTSILRGHLKCRSAHHLFA